MGHAGPMIGRLHSVVLDCPDPRALAGFYAELLGMPVVDDDPEWVDIEGDGRRVSFQRASDLRPPRWPDPAYPQQFHLDVEVDEIEAAERQALALGAERLPGGGERFRVYADPVGHPFCLVW